FFVYRKLGLRLLRTMLDQLGPDLGRGAGGEGSRGPARVMDSRDARERQPDSSRCPVGPGGGRPLSAPSNICAPEAAPLSPPCGGAARLPPDARRQRPAPELRLLR